MKNKIKASLIGNQIVRNFWARYRGGQTERRFEAWREFYRQRAKQQGLSYSREQTESAVRRRLRPGASVQRRRGEIHSLVMTLTSNWGLALVQELEPLGPTSVFDWSKFGYHEADPGLPAKLPELNSLMYKFVRDAHQERPLDWILITATGNVILRETLHRIREDLGVPTVQQWLDCKQNFIGGKTIHNQDCGQRDIAKDFDLIWTSTPSLCDAYLCEGARPIYLAEGFSPALTPRVELEKIHDVGFMGAKYGLRPDYINALLRAKIKVAVRGPGWGTAQVPLSQMGHFFSECKVNIGFGGVGYSMKLTTLKGRDFEVPGAGGVYVTTYNPDLAEWFDLGKEILCYRSPEELVEIVTALLADDDLRQTIAERGYARAMREHRWLHRYETVLRILGILQGD